MHWKKENSPVSSSVSCQRRCGPPKCPVSKVIYASEFGVVLESLRDFELGYALSVGFHVDVRDCSGRSRSVFVSAEAIVVDSRPEVNEEGALVYRTTLLYSEISSKDRGILVRASEARYRSRTSAAEPVPATSGEGSSDAQWWQKQGFGLN